MKKVNVKFMPFVANMIGKGIKEFEIQKCISSGMRIELLLNELADEYGTLFKNNIYEPGKKQIHFVIITVNGRIIQGLNQLDTVINDGDSVTFIPLYAGG